jgi:hypothetical protein
MPEAYAEQSTLAPRCKERTKLQSTNSVPNLSIAGHVFILPALLLCLTGCSHNAQPESNHVLIVVPGAGGNGPSYSRMIKGLRAGGVEDSIEIVKWGSPIFLLNLQDPEIHRKAEVALAARLADHARLHPSGRIDLAGHSAGCGVILGALRRSDPNLHVRTIIFLAPSVSPGYNLESALGRADAIHVFYSTLDRLWLGWRASNFGTYDNVKTKAAGNTGFIQLDRLPPSLQSKLIQYPYDPAWRALGHHGGHMESTAFPFAKNILAPLLTKNDGDLTRRASPPAKL